MTSHVFMTYISNSLRPKVGALLEWVPWVPWNPWIFEKYEMEPTDFDLKKSGVHLCKVHF